MIGLVPQFDAPKIDDRHGLCLPPPRLPELHAREPQYWGGRQASAAVGLMSIPRPEPEAMRLSSMILVLLVALFATSPAKAAVEIDA